MIENYNDAIDEIISVFMTGWLANSFPIVGYVPEIRTRYKEELLPDATRYWGRITLQTVDERQSAFENSSPNTKHTTTGLVFIQLFCPRTLDNGLTNLSKLATVAKNTFRNNQTPGGIWFKNARINELPDEQNWCRLNVIAEYQYDTQG